MDLKEIRQDIDRIDREMVDLFCRRMELASQVASYKKEHGLPIFVPEREQQILESVISQGSQDMAPYIRRLYNTLFALSRDYQTELTR